MFSVLDGIYLDALLHGGWTVPMREVGSSSTVVRGLKVSSDPCLESMFSALS